MQQIYAQHKNAFRNSEIILIFALKAYKYKVNWKNIATCIKKENLLLSHYSHFLLALEEVKKVARIIKKIKS